ncbi:histidine kinase [Paraflavitalea sp. CAU 1676]|uniref:sensor histidine kinase n=1 Tax=Paraflavitalea sp. CAU 1676 TaxID=3032598 RepID=UPI0023D9EDD2|nr:histidine kinase [Paraflavitalea sp. CAU 1676]MDF2186991.1 histidine kinase [Paraflavitalea sp. CAU 1676]
MGTIQEHEIIKTKLEIQEQALKNTVQEIHDNIGQILSLAKLHLGTLDFSKPEEVAQKTFNSNQLIGQAIKDLRNLARNLDANHIGRVGLLKSIEYELSFLPRNRITEPVLTFNGCIRELAKEEELMLFRIVQEGIHYFLGQSSTSLITVQIQCQDQDLEITILNKEIDQQEPGTHQQHDGNMSMIYDRSAMIGAQLQVNKALKDETIIHITFPFSNR